MKILAIIIYTLILVIFGLIGYAVMQIKLAGMNVKDFWSFIEANQTLDRLYRVSKGFDHLSVQQQIIFLQEAEQVFNAFEKVPSEIWEEDFSKYSEVLETYRNIRVLRWAEQG